MWRSTGFDDSEFVFAHPNLDLAALDRSSIQQQTRTSTTTNHRLQHVGLGLRQQNGTIFGVDDRRCPGRGGPTDGTS